MVLHTARYQQVYKPQRVPASTIDLEKALSLRKKVSAKAHTVQRAKSMFANGLDVLGARIAPSIRARWYSGYSASYSTIISSRVTLAMMDAAAMQAILASPFTTSRSLGTAPKGVTVHKHAIGLEPRIGHGARDGSADGAGHAHIVDIRRRDMAKPIAVATSAIFTESNSRRSAWSFWNR